MRALTLMLGILLALASPAQAQDARHRLLIHVNSADQDVMVEALHNATNAIDTIRKQGGSVAVEIVANGRGTAMFIEGLSPVTDEVRRIHAAYPGVVMSACDNRTGAARNPEEKCPGVAGGSGECWVVGPV